MKFQQQKFRKYIRYCPNHYNSVGKGFCFDWLRNSDHFLTFHICKATTIVVSKLEQVIHILCEERNGCKSNVVVVLGQNGANRCNDESIRE